MTLLDVHTDGYLDAARVLGEEVADCVRLAWVGLQLGLDGCSGMAGTDDVGAGWASSYDSAASSAAEATCDLLNGCYRLAALLEQTGINYAAAEQASVPGAAVAVQKRYAGQWLDGLGPLPSAHGFGVPAPGGWSLLQHTIGRLWPDGHQDRLRAASDTWSRAGTQLLSLPVDIDCAVGALMLQRAPEVDAAVTVVNGIRAQVGELAAAYRRIGVACDAYAGHLDEAHHRIIEEVTSFVEWTAGIEAGGALLAAFTFGASEAAAQAAEAVEMARAGTAIARVIDGLSVAVGAVVGEIETVTAQLAVIVDAIRPVLARRIEQVRLAAESDRGEIVIGKLLPTQRADEAAATTPESTALAELDQAAAEKATSYGWARQETLARHFSDHGRDFGASSEAEYAHLAREFFLRARREGLPTKVDRHGIVRVFDQKTNAFGSYTADGRTITFFKPSSPTYWLRQKGELQ
jgi:hypothetical protein